MSGEEGARDRCRRVQVPQGNEVCVFGDPVDDGEDDALAVHLQKTFNKVRRDVKPNLGRDVKWLEKAGQVQLFDFVALAHCAGTHEVADDCVVVVDAKVCAKALQVLCGEMTVRSVAKVDGMKTCVLWWIRPSATCHGLPRVDTILSRRRRRSFIWSSARRSVKSWNEARLGARSGAPSVRARQRLC